MSKKTFTGKIVSTKMQNAVVVAVELPKRHPMYGKTIKNTRKFKARNETDAKLNDTVVIEETRPLSKEINWIVKEKV
ncbi:MAG TPA: 30S ribosomal protein S17 [Candidatus Saccharimonadales bacterium]|nr:30S ribosomal protein S17 [Candidatus Saccharimonadales bacterium]